MTSKPTEYDKMQPPKEGWQTLPEDVEAVSVRAGPCEMSMFYASLQTNQLGELQVHPCKGCRAAMVFSPVYGWLIVHGQLHFRVSEAITEAIKEGAFRRGTSLT